MKVKALKSAVLMMLDGEPMPKMLMTVIRFCIKAMRWLVDGVGAGGGLGG